MALPGCLVLDGRDALQVEPAGEIYTYANTDSFYVSVNGSLDSFTAQVGEIRLDGRFPANQTVLVSLPSGIANGAHQLVLRAHEGTLPRSVERTLVVDRRPPTWSVTPAPGPVTSGEPLTIAVTCSRPLVPSSVTPSSARVGYPYQPSLAPPVLSADARTVSFTVPASSIRGDIWVFLQVALAGSPYTQQFAFGPWSVPIVNVVVSQPANGQATNGVITFSATASGAVPPTAELVAGDIVIASLGPPPWSFDWDTRTTPEGTYPLSLRSSGYLFAGSFPWVTIDRTPPALLRCGPEYSAPDDARWLDCVVVEFSEPVLGDPPDLLLGGVSRNGTWSYYPPGSYDHRGYRLCPPGSPIDLAALPAAQTVSLPSQQDAAGNLAGPNTCPQMTLPAWRRPWGEGPLPVAQGALAASEVALWMESGPYYVLQSGTLLALPPAGTAGAGLLGLWSGPLASDWSRVRTLNLESSSTASDLGRGVWVERVGTGPGHVYRIDNDPPGPLNRDPLRDARNPSGTRGGDYGPPAVAWSEEVASGGRAIFVKSQDGSSGVWYDLGGPALSEPAAVADEPSLARYALFGEGPVLAWIEKAPSGVPQVRAAWGPSMGVRPPPTTWTAIPEAANVDSSRAASNPTAWGFATVGKAVAWVEAGQVLARHSAGGWAAQVVNLDPAAAARLPRLDGSALDATVYWVEESASGDEIWARRWDGSAWILLPGPLNADAPGTVRRLDVDGGAVLWVDDAGGVRFRIANF